MCPSVPPEPKLRFMEQESIPMLHHPLLRGCCATEGDTQVGLYLHGLLFRLGFQTKGNSWPKSSPTPVACSGLISLQDVAGGSVTLQAGRGSVSSTPAGEKERGTVVV